MENKELNRYVGDYDHFQEVYAVKKAQKEAAYNRQQQEISELKDSWHETKPVWQPETWLCHGRRSWIRWM